MTKLRFLANPFTWGLFALALLLTLLTPWVFPGSAATLMAHFTEAWSAPTAQIIAHPLASLFFGTIGKIIPTTYAVPFFNACSAFFGALCVLLLCQITKQSILYFADEPRTQPYAERAVTIAVPVAGFALLTSPIFLRTATHFQWHTFDLFLALGALFFMFRVAQKNLPSRMAVAAFFWGLLSFEATEWLLLTPLFALLLTLIFCVERDKIKLNDILFYLIIPLALGSLLTLALIIATAFSLDASTSLTSVILNIGITHLANARALLTNSWILILLVGLLPVLLSLFILHEAGKNIRKATLFFTYIATSVLACLAILPQKLSLLQLTAPWGENYPILLATFTAFAFAGLTAVSVLFHAVKRRPEASSEHSFIRPICRHVGLIGAITLPILLIVSASIVTIKDYTQQRSLATNVKTYCDELLDLTNNSETWLLTDGYADAYLALRAAERNLPVVLFSVTQDQQVTAQQKLQQKLQESPYFATKPELREQLNLSLDIGIIPFVQDWIKNDSDAIQYFATLSLPDLWYVNNLLPLPEKLWYKGTKNREQQLSALKLPTLSPIPEISKDSFAPSPKALSDFINYMRRQRGFIANNTAFYLADAGRLEEAFTLFETVYNYDPQNVSALFNLFELINGGVQTEKRAWCEKEVQDLIKRMRGKRYRPMMLARTYGYIRSPQLISMLAGMWAMSGQTGAALSGLDMALALLDEGKKSALNQAIAAVCMTDPSRRKEAIARYQQLLTTSTSRQQSVLYIKELVRMHILEQDLDAAKAQLEQIDPTGSAPEFGYERALWLAASGQPERAKDALILHLDAFPREIEALAMLATLQLQLNELEALNTTTLPKLKSAAGTEDNYFVQIITAQLAERQKQLEKARTAYLRALQLKPEVHNLRTTVLALDIRLNDKASAARHAKQFLYQDRSLPLANYIVGALALHDGDPKRALSYLKIATDPSVTPPLPEAYNDLAEAYRQVGDWNAALATATHACKLSPNLSIARDTAAAALLELNRYREAHAYLDEALEIEKRLRPTAPDPRLYITRARLYEKEGMPDLARVALAEAKKGYDNLDPTAKAEFDALAEKIQLR